MCSIPGGAVSIHKKDSVEEKATAALLITYCWSDESKCDVVHREDATMYVVLAVKRLLSILEDKLLTTMAINYHYTTNTSYWYNAVICWEEERMCSLLPTI